MRIETVAVTVAPTVAWSRTIDWGDCAEGVIHSPFATIGNPSYRRPIVAAIVPNNHPNQLRAAATLRYAATPFALRGAHSRNRGASLLLGLPVRATTRSAPQRSKHLPGKPMNGSDRTDETGGIRNASWDRAIDA